MNGADFFLAVNFLIGLSFCGCFSDCLHSQSLPYRRPVDCRLLMRWRRYQPIAELLVAHTGFVRLFAILAFASVLAGMLLIRVGIGRLYGVPPVQQC